MSNHANALTSGLSSIGNVGWVIQYFVWAAIIGGVGYAAWYYLRYNITVNIYDGKFKEQDKGRIKRDDSNGRVKSFELRKYQDDFVGDIKKEHLVPIKKKFGISYEVNMYRDEEGNLRAITPPQSEDYRSWQGSDSADYKWVGLMMQEAANRYTEKSFWDQYGAVIMNIAYVGAIAVLIVVVQQGQEAVAQAFSNGASDIASTFSEQAQELSTQVINSTR